nr:MAG TPA: Protein of unknown function (DUF551) [Caudoviricetes sp.]
MIVLRILKECLLTCNYKSMNENDWKIVADEEPPIGEIVLLSAGSLPNEFKGYFDGEDFVCEETGETVEYFRVLHWQYINE